MYFKIIISVLVAGLIYTQAKTAYWSHNVAASYMKALYYTSRCHTKQPYEGNIKIGQYCDKHWADYEMKRVNYKKYFPL